MHIVFHATKQLHFTDNWHHLKILLFLYSDLHVTLTIWQFSLTFVYFPSSSF